MRRIAASLLFLALSAGLLYWPTGSEAELPRLHFAEFPTYLGAWECARRERLSTGVVGLLGVTDYLQCGYVRPDPPALVSVYVGYHAHQLQPGNDPTRVSEIHTPRHCFPGAGWEIVAARVTRLDLPGLPGGPADVNRLLIGKGNQRQLVYYWYQSRGRVIAQEWEKTFYLLWDHARRRRTDGALVRFSIPIFDGKEGEAEAQFRDLARDLLPRLGSFLPD